MNPATTSSPNSSMSGIPAPVDLIGSLIRQSILKKEPGPLIEALAHEVRNPLSNINLSLVLLEAIIKDNDIKVYLDIIRRSSIRINNLMVEMLKQRQEDDILASVHSAHDLLDEVLEMAKDRIQLKNISVTKIYASENCNVLLHRSTMQIALTNIVINAIDSMEAENGRLTIITQYEKSKYTIHIKDNGCGISKENLNKIFKSHYTNKPGGLGVGLTATHKILLANHVEMKVESVEGAGTDFFLFFNTIQQQSSHKTHESELSEQVFKNNLAHSPFQNGEEKAVNKRTNMLKEYNNLQLTNALYK